MHFFKFFGLWKPHPTSQEIPISSAVGGGGREYRDFLKLNIHTERKFKMLIIYLCSGCYWRLLIYKVFYDLIMSISCRTVKRCQTILLGKKMVSISCWEWMKKVWAQPRRPWKVPDPTKSALKNPNHCKWCMQMNWPYLVCPLLSLSLPVESPH